MIQEVVMALLEFVFGSTEGLTTAVTLAFGAHCLRKTARLGGIINTLSWFAVLLGVLVAVGVVDVYPGTFVTLIGRLITNIVGIL